MNVLTIPKSLIKNDDLVILPRRDYEVLLGFRKTREIALTPALKRIIIQARKNRKGGNFLSFNELRNKLGFRD